MAQVWPSPALTSSTLEPTVSAIVKVPNEKLLSGPITYFAVIEFILSVGVMLPRFAHRTTTMFSTPLAAADAAGVKVQPVADPVYEKSDATRLV